jgi:hypothetical protein
MDTITNPTAIFPFMSAAQDTADTDTATAGCAYARASRSNADDISDQDDESLFEAYHPIELISDGGEWNLYWVLVILNNPSPHCQKHRTVYFDYPAQLNFW